MTAERIDGKAFAALLRERVGALAGQFSNKTGRKAGLAVVLVGEDPASQVYVRSKHKATVAAGMESFEHRLPADTTDSDLLALIEQLNNDDAVDGILVQLPLPDHLDEQTVIASISPDKDVDGFHVTNAGRLAVGQRGFVPCAHFAGVGGRGGAFGRGLHDPGGTGRGLVIGVVAATGEKHQQAGHQGQA